MMTNDTLVETFVKICSIRRREDFAITLVCTELDHKYNVLDHSRYLVVKVKKYKTNTLTFYPNEVWKFSGTKDERVIATDRFIGKENELHAETATLIQVSGDNFVDELYKSKEYTGISHTLAKKLWITFGESIYDILDARDPTPLIGILKKNVAENLITVWNEKGIAKQIRWIELVGIPSKIGNACVNYYKAKTIDKIKANPYRLLPFSADWKTVDSLATDKFGIVEDDPKRLFAAVDQSVHLGVKRSRNGHTAFTKAQLKKVLRSTLKDSLVNKALENHSRRTLVSIDKFFIPSGYFVQEKYVAIRVAQCAKADSKAQFGAHYERRLSDFESTLSFPLAEKQREAIKKSIEYRITILTGGAGCGKTTTLVGMIDLLEFAGYNIIQMALSGRAALRMTESSGKDALTIAAFRTHNPVDSLPDKTCIIIDEASMISLNDAFAILRRLPHKGKIILIGDPVQLPPIGAGLFFKPLAALKQLTDQRTELTEVKRQSETTGIPKIANAIRFHKWPNLPDYKGLSVGVSFLRTDKCDIHNATLQVFLDLSNDGEDVRVLTPLKGTNLGTGYLNTEIQAILRKSDKDCMMWSRQFMQVIHSGFKLNDKVVFLTNDYKRGLRNGSLGIVVKEYEPSEDQEYLMDVIFDEGLVSMRLSDLEHVQLAYALTVHKAQGSQFDRVVLPVVESVLTDQSLIYTGLTRTVTQATFIGVEEQAKRIVEAPPSASLRQVGIEKLLSLYLSDYSGENVKH